MGALSLPSERSARSRTSPGRVSERRTLPLLGLGRGVLPKNAESLRNSDALMRVAVPRRRGPAGLRDPIAVSLTALMCFTVLVVHDSSTQGKIPAAFTRWSAPFALPRATVPLLCPQHPTAADKTGRWKTGWAGSCRVLNLVTEEQRPLRVCMNNGKELLLFPQDLLAPIRDADFRLILLSAMRYAMGRNTYMPAVVSGYIKRHIRFLDDKFLALAADDIQRYLEDYAEYEPNSTLWQALLDALETEQRARATHQAWKIMSGPICR